MYAPFLGLQIPCSFPNKTSYANSLLIRCTLGTILCFSLTACVDQPPAPIEYKERGITVSNSGNVIDNDEGIITSSTIEEAPKLEVSDSLEEPAIETTENDNDAVVIPTTKHDEEITKLIFEKPLDGEIVTEFKEGKNKGIDIAVLEESSVNSIGSGTVIFSGNNAQFGNLVIVKLDKDDLEVAYAGLKDLSVKKGRRVIKHIRDLSS
ncbi:MAG: peptidoglycan DD-metalloendopeptidase family protein [Janthinobacterium lividum]